MPSAKPTERCDRVPLVLLPGTLCDARIFAPLQRCLAQVPSQVIVTPEACSLEEAADEVLLRAPDRFALLGFSLGGMVAMEVALRAPARVSGLVLLSTTPLPVPPERHAVRRAVAERARMVPMERLMDEQLWQDYGGAPGDVSTLPLLQQMAASLGRETFARQTEMALRRADFRPRLGGITCPVLILAGTKDVLCPPTAQQCLTAALPHSACVMVQGAGHFALWECADEIATAVAAWFHTLHATDTAAG